MATFERVIGSIAPIMAGFIRVEGYFTSLNVKRELIWLPHSLFVLYE